MHSYPAIIGFSLLAAAFIALARQLTCRGQDCHPHLTERQLDKTIEDSFPASDPPGTY